MRGYQVNHKGPAKGAAITGKETKPEPITKRVKAKEKPAAKKGKMPSELVERFKSKSATKAVPKPGKKKSDQRISLPVSTPKTEKRSKRIAKIRDKNPGLSRTETEAKLAAQKKRRTARKSSEKVEKVKPTKGTKHVGQKNYKK